ncbi:hypothetical protein [Dactylosporangium sp. NPDC050588]|uniref:hypothetical protein n=1 Tax=Dactylosporangium sp. NPDC050588 TaxID=3157211 RepID=UPI0033ECB4EC
MTADAGGDPMQRDDIVLAHEKWFLKDPSAYTPDWSFATRPATLAVLALVVAVTVAWRAAGRRVGTPELGILRPLGRITPYLPRLLAIHLGVSLLTLAARGYFLAADLELHELPAPALLGVVEGALGVWFITGYRLRPAALLLVVVGPVALAATGPVSLLEAADLLGIAGFLAFLPPSGDRHGAVTPDPKTLRRALLALRVGVATALVTLAFSEKLANPAMARATLEHYPQLDVFAYLGLHVPADTFILVAGATELLFGLLVLSGAMPQLAMLVAAVPFNATLLIFGAPELLGHLPVYGVFLTLLAYGSDPATAGDVRWLPRLRRTPAPQPATA